MKLSVTLSVAFLTSTVYAWPDIGRYLEEQRANERRTGGIPFPPIGGVPRLNGTVPFNAKEQLVSVSGDHVVRESIPHVISILISILISGWLQGQTISEVLVQD